MKARESVAREGRPQRVFNGGLELRGAYGSRAFMPPSMNSWVPWMKLAWGLGVGPRPQPPRHTHLFNERGDGPGNGRPSRAVRQCESAVKADTPRHAATAKSYQKELLAATFKALRVAGST